MYLTEWMTTWLTMMSIFSLSLISCQNFADGELDSLNWKMNLIKEADRSSISKIHNFERELEHLEKDIYSCNARSNIGNNDIDVLNEEVDEEDKKKKACEVRKEWYIEKTLTPQSKISAVRKDIVRMKEELGSCRDELSRPVSPLQEECNCDECDARIEGMKDDKMKMMDKFTKCKLMNQGHKTFKFFEARGINSHRKGLVVLDVELDNARKRVESQKDNTFKDDIEQLKADYRTLVRGHEALKAEGTELDINYRVCTAETDHAENQAKNTAIALEDQEETIDDLMARKVDLEQIEVETSKAQKTNKTNTMIVALINFAGGSMKLYQVANRKWNEYHSKQKKEKVSKKQEKSKHRRR